MKINFSKPPLWEEINKKFKVKETDDIFYTFGDTIYSPNRVVPSDDVIKHEEQHAEQQNHNDKDAEIWWRKFIHDPEFRVVEEGEAYGAQYRFLCQKYKDRNYRAKILWNLAEILSSNIYGNCINHSEALKVIRQFAEYGKPKIK